MDSLLPGAFVVGVDIPAEWLKPLIDAGVARVVIVEALGPSPKLSELGEPLLLVARSHPESVAGIRARWPAVPVLVFVEDDAVAPGVIEAGADYVLPTGVAPSLVLAIYRAAERRTRSRLIITDAPPPSLSALAKSEEIEQWTSQLADAQTQLLHSSRLAALGQMAAGVAHEINNPLQCVLAGIDELSEIERLDVEQRQTLSDMREGAQRIRSVTLSLLPFARVDNAQLEPVDLNEVVEWAARVTANEIRHRAQLELNLGVVGRIHGQRVRLGQLVTNLLSNAAHAITEGASDRHRIKVTTDMVKGRVRLLVEDTGRGIPEDVRPRIFEPFFTTKPRDLGTGLGLALCASIVHRHGGTINFESTTGVGTRFVVVFGESESDIRTPSPKSEATPTATRRPRLLLIDDEEIIVRTYSRFLKQLDVIPAIGGKAALEVLARDMDFDVILCDLMMPTVDGPMIYAHISEVAPHLVDRILFCSGGAFTSRVRDFLERIPNVVLDKPVSPKHLRAAIDKLVTRH